MGVANLVTVVPIGWQQVDAQAELKYRRCAAGSFKTTLIDQEKIQHLNNRVRDGHINCYIIWAFTDCDMYWKVDPSLEFYTAMGRNTSTTEDVPGAHKPVVFIPMTLLSVCTADMFVQEK